MKDKKAFTLAETLIVLVILGVIASITIPAVVRRQVEASNRTRIKKAMTVYDTAINKMVVENGLKSDNALYSSDPNDNRAFAPQNNCTRSSAYFKINRTLNDDNGTNCRFCSSDNVCWDISNIIKPIIGIGEEGITNENSNNRYRMFAHFGDNGELRVDDLAYEQSHEYLTDNEKEELETIYSYIKGNKMDSSIEEKKYKQTYLKYLNGDYNNACVNPNDNNINCTNCKGCKVTKSADIYGYIIFTTIYDDNGNIIYNNNMEGDGEVYIHDNKGNLLTTMIIGGQDCSVDNIDYIDLCKDYGFPDCYETNCRVEDYH